MALRLGLRQGSVVAASRLGAAHCVPARPIAVRAARLQLAMVPATAMTRATWSGSSSIEELPEELPPRPPAPTTGQHVSKRLLCKAMQLRTCMAGLLCLKRCADLSRTAVHACRCTTT